jgi:predicted metal-dependent phosphoesterase TrpH
VTDPVQTNEGVGSSEFGVRSSKNAGFPTSNSELRTPNFGRADIHLHTDTVDGLQSPADLIEYAQCETDLDVVAVTDHDEIRGAFAAREIAAQRNSRLHVITGTEVTTRHGHVLALFVDRAFPMLKTIDATLAAIHEAGGIAIVPHPMSWLTTSIGERNLRRIHALGAAGRQSGVYFDAIEMLNPSVAGRVAHRRARTLNRDVLRLPVMAGSDAHASDLIGSAYTTFPCGPEGTRTADDLRAAFVSGTTRAHGRFWTFGEHRAIAGESLYRAWVLVPVRKASQIAGRVRGGSRLSSLPPCPEGQAGKPATTEFAPTGGER